MSYSKKRSLVSPRTSARTRDKSNPSKTNYWKQTMSNPAKGWTLERRKQQSEAIRKWKPWNKSTGPTSPEGKAVVARNGYSDGETQMLRQSLKRLKMVFREQKESLKRLSD